MHCHEKRSARRRSRVASGLRSVAPCQPNQSSPSQPTQAGPRRATPRLQAASPVRNAKPYPADPDALGAHRKQRQRGLRREQPTLSTELIKTRATLDAHIDVGDEWRNDFAARPTQSPVCRAGAAEASSNKGCESKSPWPKTARTKKPPIAKLHTAGNQANVTCKHISDDQASLHRKQDARGPAQHLPTCAGPPPLTARARMLNDTIGLGA